MTLFLPVIPSLLATGMSRSNHSASGSVPSNGSPDYGTRCRTPSLIVSVLLLGLRLLLGCRFRLRCRLLRGWRSWCSRLRWRRCLRD